MYYDTIHFLEVYLFSSKFHLQRNTRNIIYISRIQLVKSTCSRKIEAIETRKFQAIKPIKCSFAH